MVGRMGLVRIAVVLLLAGTLSAADMDSTSKLMRTSIYEQLYIDTTGSDGLPVYLAMQYARAGVERVGWDVGLEKSKALTLAANTEAALVDTALIRVGGIAIDTLGTIRSRWLQEVPFDSLKKVGYSGGTANRNPTYYAVFGDSVYFAPVSAAINSFAVRYYAKANYLTDSTTVVNIPEEWRQAAIQWACVMASQRLRNGKMAEFRDMYDYLIARIWAARLGMSVNASK